MFCGFFMGFFHIFFKKTKVRFSIYFLKEHMKEELQKMKVD
jgi:hypothetical protein